MCLIDAKKYGTASEVAAAVSEPRTTIINAANRGEIDKAETLGGTLLLSITSAKRWAKQTRKPGRKPNAKAG